MRNRLNKPHDILTFSTFRQDTDSESQRNFLFGSFLFFFFWWAFILLVAHYIKNVSFILTGVFLAQNVQWVALLSLNCNLKKKVIKKLLGKVGSLTCYACYKKTHFIVLPQACCGRTLFIQCAHWLRKHVDIYNFKWDSQNPVSARRTEVLQSDFYFLFLI